MKFTKFAAGTITTIIALWIGMWVLKILLALFGVAVGLLATLFGIALLIVKLVFLALLIGGLIALVYFVYCTFFKPKPEPV